VVTVTPTFVHAGIVRAVHFERPPGNEAIIAIRTFIKDVAEPVAVRIFRFIAAPSLACVTDAVAVAVALIGIGCSWTVITEVGEFVASIVQCGVRIAQGVDNAAAHPGREGVGHIVSRTRTEVLDAARETVERVDARMFSVWRTCRIAATGCPVIVGPIGKLLKESVAIRLRR
jgi:hypothetical protein